MTYKNKIDYSQAVPPYRHLRDYSFVFSSDINDWIRGKSHTLRANYQEEREALRQARLAKRRQSSHQLINQSSHQ